MSIAKKNTVYSTTHKKAINRPMDRHRSDVTHILCKASCFFLIEILSFSQVTETIGFSPIQILIFRMWRNNADVRRCLYFEPGLAVVTEINLFRGSDPKHRKLLAGFNEPQSSSKEQRDKMANETVEEEDLSKEVAVFLDKNVGVEKETTSEIYSLLQDALMKKKCLETEVCYPNNSLKLKVSLRLRFWLLAWRCIFSRRFSSNNLKRWLQVFFFYLGLNFRQKISLTVKLSYLFSHNMYSGVNRNPIKWWPHICHAYRVRRSKS